MENKVKISKDGSSIDFAQSDKVPVSPKKFRQGPELEGFYRFVFEHDLRKEALLVIDRIYLARKALKMKKPLEALKKAKLAAKEAMKSAIVASEKKTPMKKAEAPTAPVKKMETKKATAKTKVTKAAQVKAAPKAKTAPKAKAKPQAKAKKAPAKKSKKK